LYEIDIAAQAVTFVAPYPDGETDVDGLAVANGIAYYVTDNPNTTQPHFYMYDLATGTLLGTVASPFTGSGTFAASTFVVPEPSSVGVAGGLLALAAAMLARRRGHTA